MATETQAPSTEGRDPQILRSLAFLITAGALSIAWSEVAWGVASPQDHRPSTLLFLLGAYTAIAGILVWAIRTFKVNELWSLVLAAALFGWLGEGAIAATMFPLFPIGITWTALGWHGLLTVVGGWWLLPRFLRSASLGQVMVLGALVGLGVGVWSVNSLDPRQLVQPRSVYMQLAVLVALVAVFYPVFDRLRPGGRLLTTPPVPALLAASVAGWFAVAVVPAQPWAPLLLLPLLAGVLLLLRRHGLRRGPDAGDVLTGGPTISPWRSAPFAVAMGAVATAVYSTALLLGWRLDTGPVVFVGLSLLGVLVLGAAVVHVLRQPATSA